ncbi:MAG: helix-turn-helix domain-containing protein [Bryobacteraceae bacterium]
MRYDPFVVPESRSDIEELIRNELQESIHLDYKDSRAVSSKARDEIAKDVSAFANSDGGVLIYGVSETNHLPTSIDQGVDDAAYSREWIESAVLMKITPRVDARLAAIPVGPGRSAYVIEVPKAFRGPHQASDKRYYKRHNFSSVPMEDYEIADVRSRRNVYASLVSFRAEIYSRAIFVFDIENNGDVVAKDVRFEFSLQLQWPRSKSMPAPLVNGISDFPPRQKLRFLYFRAADVFGTQGIAPMQFSVRITYTRADTEVRTFEDWPVNLEMYRDAMANRSDEEAFRDKLLETLESISDRLLAVSSSIGHLPNATIPGQK